MDRIIKFGKYKGKDIKYLILTHIGYIMWCLNNISWFKLNEEEQNLYDAIAIASKKYNITYTFSTEDLCAHVVNREKLKKLETPFIFNNGYIAFKNNEKDNHICKSVEKYVTKKEEYGNTNNYSLSDLSGLQQVFSHDWDNYWSEVEDYETWHERDDFNDLLTQEAFMGW